MLKNCVLCGMGILRRVAQSPMTVYVDPVKNVDAQISMLFSDIPRRSGHDCQSPECFPQDQWIFIWLPLMEILVSVIRLLHLSQVLKS